MENLKLLQKLSWSFNKTTGIPFDELLSEARVLYWEAKADWRPDMGASLVTYAYTRVKNGLIAFCKKEFQAKTVFIEDDKVSSKLDEMIYENSESFLYELSGMGKIVADYLLHDESINIKLSPRKIKGELIMIMRCDGYTISQIYNGFREVKKVIK